jgi:hypothetical protein
MWLGVMKYIPNFMTILSGIQVILILLRQEASELVLLTTVIYEVGQ